MLLAAASGDEQVLGDNLGVIELAGQVLRGHHRFLGLFSEFVEIHCHTRQAALSVFAAVPFNFASFS